MKRLALLLYLLWGTSLFAATPTLVQHASFSGSEGQNITAYNARMPNAVLSGNLIVVGIAETITGSTPTPTVSDDKSNTYSTACSATFGNRKAWIFYAFNVTNGPRIVKFTWSANAQPEQIGISEFYNVDTSSPFDVCSNASGSTPDTQLTAGSLTTAVDGELVWSFDIQDDTSYAAQFANEMTSWTPSSNATCAFSILHADLKQLHSANYCIESTHGTHTYNVVVQNPSNNWATLTAAFKSATAGSAPGAGIHIDRVYHININVGWSGTTAKQQIPATGNLLVFLGASEPSASLSTISDSQGNTWTNRTSVGGSNVQANHADSVSPTNSSTNILTWVYALSVNGGEPCLMFDISGANGYDTRGTATGNDGGGLTITGASVTPTVSNDLILSVLATTDNAAGQTILDWCGQVSGSCAFGYGIAADSTPEIPTSPIDENDGFGAGYDTSGTSTVTSLWTKNITNATGDWSDITAAYKSASVATTTQTHYRWRNDDGSETTATWKANEDTSSTVATTGTNFRLRIQVNTSGTLGAQSFKLQAKVSTDSTYQDVPLVNGSQTSQSFTASSSWNAPAWTTSVKAEAWGGGGAGARVTTNTTGGAGGGGGGYGLRNALTVVPGTNYPFTVGNGGTATGTPANGGASTFTVSGTSAIGNGGTTPANNATSGGAGGSGTGDTTRTGGTGGTSGASTRGGGGGEGACTTGNGNNGVNGASGGTGGTGCDGGDGGTGKASGSNGVGGAGTIPGGAGGGSYRQSTSQSGGAGAKGQITLTYTPAPPSIIAVSANISAGCDATTQQLTAQGGTFTAGKICDDQNPAPSVTIAASGYSEFEWDLQLTSNAVLNTTYNFRITLNGVALSTYDVTPAITYQAAGGVTCKGGLLLIGAGGC